MLGYTLHGHTHLNPAGPMKLWVLGVGHGPIRIHKSLRDANYDVMGVGHNLLFHAVISHTPVIHPWVTSTVITPMISQQQDQQWPEERRKRGVASKQE